MVLLCAADLEAWERWHREAEGPDGLPQHRGLTALPLLTTLTKFLFEGEERLK